MRLKTTCMFLISQRSLRHAASVTHRRRLHVDAMSHAPARPFVCPRLGPVGTMGPRGMWWPEHQARRFACGGSSSGL